MIEITARDLFFPFLFSVEDFLRKIQSQYQPAYYSKTVGIHIANSKD